MSGPHPPLSRVARARLKVLASVVSATLFILPFKVAARDGRGGGAALGLLFCVGVLFLPWAAVRWSRNDAAQRRRTFSLAWKMGLAGALGNIAQGYAFEHLHPGVAATFIQLNVLFVALLGIVWLSEPLRFEIGLGVALAVLGIALSHWPALQGGLEWSLGVPWAIMAAFGFSLLDLLSRKHAHGADGVVTNVLRAWISTLVLAAVPGTLSQLLSMDWLAWGACALAAVLGPGIGRLFLISASRDLPAAESALLQQLRPPLAIPLASIFFAVWPSVWEWWGSALVTAGVAIPLAIGVMRRRAAGTAIEA